MNCCHCRAWNEKEDHRCVRCGRRIPETVARAEVGLRPLTGATAPALDTMLTAEVPNRGLRDTPPARVAYQPPLFREMQTVMPVLAPPTPRRNMQRRAVGRRAPEGQQALDFEAVSAPAPPFRTAVPEAAIYCKAPVALPIHRMMAAALDFAMVVLGMALFLFTFYLAGNEMPLDRHTLPVLLGAVIVLALFYHFLWCIAGGETAGMRWTQLRLLSFDGKAPDREQRAYRMAASCLSLVSAGLGLVWALVDEESLTWHDHMSKTFPSPFGGPVSRR